MTKNVEECNGQSGNGVWPRPKVAVLIPCYNEALTVGKVVADFRQVLPDADIYVFDNNSTDGTAATARENGATVILERRQGKGHVVAAMFQKVDADAYIMVDGDDTYDASAAAALLAPVLNGDADMVVGRRVAIDQAVAYPRFHVFGNWLVASLVRWIFFCDLRDIMSGYRAFGRDIAETLPLLASGFEVETEFTLQALYRRYRIMEVDAPYRERPAGSFSKLSTFRDGFRVLYTIFTVFKDFKPLTFFGGIGLLLGTLSLLAGAVVTVDYMADGYVNRVPTALLAVGLAMCGALSILAGLVLTTINTRFKELHVMMRRNRGKD